MLIEKIPSNRYDAATRSRALFELRQRNYAHDCFQIAVLIVSAVSMTLRNIVDIVGLGQRRREINIRLILLAALEPSGKYDLLALIDGL